MDRPQFLQRIIEWLRAGYPEGVPQADYIPLVALLRRQLTEEEIEEVSADLIAESAPPPEPISKIDAGVKITKVTHELPHEADVTRVRKHLEASGWPFDDSPLAPATPPPPTEPKIPPTEPQIPPREPNNPPTEPDDPAGDES